MKYNANATQAEAIKFLLSHKKSILCLEPGSGKKSIILSVLNELKYDYFENRRVLLISKKSNIYFRWIPEIQKWDHLKSLTYSICLKEKEAENLQENVNIIFTSVEKMHLLFRVINNESIIVVIDDDSIFCNSLNKSFSLIKSISDKAKRLIISSDRNVKSDLGILWNMMFILDSGKKLGNNKEAFLNKYFYRNIEKKSGHYICVNEPKPEAWDVVRGRISNSCFWSNMGNSVLINSGINLYVDLNKSDYSKYLLASKVAETFNSMSDTDDLNGYNTIEDQMADGFLKNFDGDVIVFHEEKLKELMRLINAIPYDRFLIVVPYLFERKYLEKFISNCLAIKDACDYSLWLGESVRVATISMDSPFLKDTIQSFRSGVIVSFRKANYLDMCMKDYKYNIKQINILIDIKKGY